jgi:hypothetical protein
MFLDADNGALRVEAWPSRAEYHPCEMTAGAGPSPLLIFGHS